jgi:ABC-type nitrate/sulfonate/bicarbonate transport system substrate-binding protein
VNLRAWFAAGAILLGLLAFFLWKSGAPKPAPPAEKIVLATANVMLSSLIFIADKEDCFRREGLAVDIAITPTGKEALDMARHGQADFAAVASPPLTHAILNGEQISIIATIAKSDHAFAIIASTTSGIRQATDLRGRKVALKRGTAFEFYLDAILIDAGIPPSDVVKVDMDPLPALAAMKAGNVDATVQATPFTERTLQAQGLSAALLSPTFYTTHWNVAATERIIASRSAAAEKLLRALVAAEAFAEQHRDKALADIAQWLHLAPADLSEAWGRDLFRVQLSQSLIVGMEDETRWINMGRNSRSPAMPTPNFLDYLDVEPLRKVKPDAIRITR